MNWSEALQCGHTSESSPEIFEMESNGEVEEWFSTCVVMDKTCEVYSLDSCDETDDPKVDWSQDSLFSWYGDCSHELDMLHVRKGDNVDGHHIRAVPLMDPQLIVLDSGADISLLPKAMCEEGVGKKLVKRFCKMPKVT